MLPVAGLRSLSRPAITEMERPSLLIDARSSGWEEMLSGVGSAVNSAYGPKAGTSRCNKLLDSVLELFLNLAQLVDIRCSTNRTECRES
jgi:hypothetical protein